MTLSINHLMMLRCLVNKGWPADLIAHLPTRCGAAQQDFANLVDAGLAEKRGDRFFLTKEGKREYQINKKGKWF